MSRAWFAALTIAFLLAVPPLTFKVDRYKSLMQADPSREARVLDFLAKRRFETTIERLPDPLFLIHARLGGCRMDLREVAPQGFDRSTITAIAAGRQVFYVDNGTVSREQPAWRTWAHLHFRRFASFLGWPVAKRLTFAVISSGDCTDLDWATLATPPERPARIRSSISTLPRSGHSVS